MVIDQIEEFNTHTLSIAGGEPLMSPNFKGIFSYARGKFKRLVVSSNGTMLNSKWADFLSRYATNVQISLDDPKDVHDYIRGDGVFDKAINAIKLLQKAGVTVGVRMTLCQKNKTRIKEYINIARDLGLPDAYLRRIIPSGNALKTGLGELSSEELRDCLGLAIAYGKEQGLHVASADYFCQISFNNEARLKAEKIQSLKGQVVGGCAIGINSFYLMQNGVIAYCPYLPIYCGDLRTSSLNDIWENSEMIKRARNIRFNLKGKCSKCRYLYACGGCVERMHMLLLVIFVQVIQVVGCEN